MSKISSRVIKKVGVIGAGQMGSGIAQVSAVSGFDVVLTDVSKQALETSRELIERDFSRQVSRNKMSDESMTQAIGRITSTVELESHKDCDLLIEAVSEDEALKKTIFAELDSFVSEDAIVASNTSSISITSLASSIRNSERFIGLHFMNPVPIMPLVEVICGLATSDATFKDIEGFVEKIGKSYIVSQDYPGFIVNRLLMPMLNEACYALYEGLGTIEAIDQGMKLGTNHPMGPFELADLIGLDTCYSIMKVLHQSLDGSKYQPCPLLINYVEAGWLGRKTGRGFYDYSGEKPTPTR